MKFKNHFFGNAVLFAIAFMATWNAIFYGIAFAIIGAVYAVINIFAKIKFPVHSGRGFCRTIETIALGDLIKLFIGKAKLSLFLTRICFIPFQKIISVCFASFKASVCIPNMCNFISFCGIATAGFCASLLKAAQPYLFPGSAIAQTNKKIVVRIFRVFPRKRFDSHFGISFSDIFCLCFCANHSSLSVPYMTRRRKAEAELFSA